MRWTFRHWAISIAIVTLLISGLSCGGGGGRGEATASDYEVRQALVSAMGTDQVLDSDIIKMVEQIKAGQLDLQTGLDDMVDRNRTLLSLIESVSKPGIPPDPNLAEAQEKMGDYLRNRVHQFESTMEVSSIEEFEAAFNAPKADLEKELNEIRSLLLEYDPQLNKSKKPY